ELLAPSSGRPLLATNIRGTVEWFDLSTHTKGSAPGNDAVAVRSVEFDQDGTLIDPPKELQDLGEDTVRFPELQVGRDPLRALGLDRNGQRVRTGMSDESPAVAARTEPLAGAPHHNTHDEAQLLLLEARREARRLGYPGIVTLEDVLRHRDNLPVSFSKATLKARGEGIAVLIADSRIGLPGGGSGIEAEFTLPIDLADPEVDGDEMHGEVLAVGPNGARITVESKDFYLDEDDQYHRTRGGDFATVRSIIPEVIIGVMGVHSGEPGVDANGAYQVYAGIESALQSIDGSPGGQPSVPIEDIFRPEDGWTIAELGKGARVGPRPIGDNPGAHVHHNIGVPVAGLYSFLTHVRDNTWRNQRNGPYYTQENLSDGLLFGRRIGYAFAVHRQNSTRVPNPAFDAAGGLATLDESVESLQGFAALLYTVAATATQARFGNHLEKVQAAVLPRHDLSEIRAHLSRDVQEYLAFDAGSILQYFVDIFQARIPFFNELLESRGSDAVENVTEVKLTDARLGTTRDLILSGLWPAYQRNVRMRDLFTMNVLGPLDSGDGRLLPQVVLEVRSYGARHVEAPMMIQHHETLRHAARLVYERSLSANRESRAGAGGGRAGLYGAAPERPRVQSPVSEASTSSAGRTLPEGRVVPTGVEESFAAAVASEELLADLPPTLVRQALDAYQRVRPAEVMIGDGTEAGGLQLRQDLRAMVRAVMEVATREDGVAEGAFGQYEAALGDSGADDDRVRSVGGRELGHDPAGRDAVRRRATSDVDDSSVPVRASHAPESEADAAPVQPSSTVTTAQPGRAVAQFVPQRDGAQALVRNEPVPEETVTWLQDQTIRAIERDAPQDADLRPVVTGPEPMASSVEEETGAESTEAEAEKGPQKGDRPNQEAAPVPDDAPIEDGGLGGLAQQSTTETHPVQPPASLLKTRAEGLSVRERIMAELMGLDVASVVEQGPGRDPESALEPVTVVASGPVVSPGPAMPSVSAGNSGTVAAPAPGAGGTHSAARIRGGAGAEILDDWIRFSSVTGKPRSHALKRIDRAVALLNTDRSAYGAATVVVQAIDAWREGKTGSARWDQVQAL
ncbi:hypothetical protein ACFVW1_54170, partial [Streptomyces olivochromogenes]|uniref:hypothetical protein n=1 Tax=Streptomyces olivochromogenes TaxID=1963 RepID=UPI0036DC3D54